MSYVPDVPCPRCGQGPAEITEAQHAARAFVPACTCYPHPPRCPLCHHDLEDGRCINLRGVCPVFDQVVPFPDVDPLWDDVAHHHIAVCIWCTSASVCPRCDGRGVYEHAGGEYACLCGIEDDGVPR